MWQYVPPKRRYTFFSDYAASRATNWKAKIAAQFLEISVQVQRSSLIINPLASELFFLILAHPVYKI